MAQSLAPEVKLLLLQHISFEELLFLDYVTKPVFLQGGTLKCEVRELVTLVKSNCKELYELEQESMSEVHSLLWSGGQGSEKIEGGERASPVTVEDSPLATSTSANDESTKDEKNSSSAQRRKESADDDV